MTSFLGYAWSRNTEAGDNNMDATSRIWRKFIPCSAYFVSVDCDVRVHVFVLQPNIPMETSVNVTLRGDIVEVYRVMLKGFVVTEWNILHTTSC